MSDLETPTAYWYDNQRFGQAVSSLRISTAGYQDPYSASDWHVAMAFTRMAEVELLIRSHAGPLEAPNYRAPSASAMDPLLTSLGTCWMLTPECWRLRPDFGARLLGLMRLAHRHGADLEANSHRGLPVLFSVALSKQHTAPVLAQLIALGANPGSVPNGTQKLTDLCAERCGPAGVALVTEALMRRRLAAELEVLAGSGEPPSQSGPQPHCRRPFI